MSGLIHGGELNLSKQIRQSVTTQLSESLSSGRNTRRGEGDGNRAEEQG